MTDRQHTPEEWDRICGMDSPHLCRYSQRDMDAKNHEIEALSRAFEDLNAGAVELERENAKLRASLQQARSAIADAMTVRHRLDSDSLFEIDLILGTVPMEDE